ncbi:VLRF1 family aeRF1-type release factor [Nocardiopsis gilva]|nr:VLRF1 family aeRF1-type release factor [Nocardiopsis gilva]
MTVILDQTSLRDLATMSDDSGVLSVYATADPRDRTASPTWRRTVANAITRLRNKVASNGDKKHAAAVLTRLEALEPELDGILGATEPGLGRALFAPVSSDEVRTVVVQVPLDDCAVLEPKPYLRPLAAAFATGAPAGVLAVAQDGVRVVDMRFGIARDLTRFTFAADTGEWREMRGPGSAGRPGIADRSASQTDRFDRRMEEQLLRYLHSVRPRITELADEQGWRSIVITGDSRLIDVVRKGLPANGPRDIVLLDRVVETLSASDIAARVRPELEAARVRRCRTQAEQARDAALSGGQGTVGLSDTLGAFREGRVAHLFLDGSREMRGHRAANGWYYAQGETPPGESATDMTSERDLGERMIELGLVGGSEVTVLPEGAADVLAEDDGVAALLRW